MTRVITTDWIRSDRQVHTFTLSPSRLYFTMALAPSILTPLPPHDAKKTAYADRIDLDRDSRVSGLISSKVAVTSRCGCACRPRGYGSRLRHVSEVVGGLGEGPVRARGNVQYRPALTAAGFGPSLFCCCCCCFSMTSTWRNGNSIDCVCLQPSVDL